ncbi:hypothetical protein BKK81_09140 [Cupriavidus sp. USMAHM13]|nr:hypothetical protein BKK81_09140 [Cupriavidus sp. USMAHM13]
MGSSGARKPTIAHAWYDGCACAGVECWRCRRAPREPRKLIPALNDMMARPSEADDDRAAMR